MERRAGARLSFGAIPRLPRVGLRWADLLRRIYDVDMRTCRNCGLGSLELIATILDPDAIARILAAMALQPRALSA
jgi:hypothetical protein